jgi:hypothetical protein
VAVFQPDVVETHLTTHHAGALALERQSGSTSCSDD